MPVTKLSFRPGINKESTSYANEGTYYDGNWVRFRSGYPEKIGGWQNFSIANTFKGVARSLQSWVTYANQKLLGIGTSQKFYVEYGTQYFDITPVRPFSATTDAFTLGTDALSATTGSKLVTVTHATHGVVPGTYVRFTSTAPVGGMTVSGEHEVISVLTGNIYTIAVTTDAYPTTFNSAQLGLIGQNIFIGETPAANTLVVEPAILRVAGQTVELGTTAMLGGGTVTATYDINAGSSTYATPSNSGWGAGPYGNGGWGESTGVVALTETTTYLRLWSQCNYGEDLIMAPRGGTLYYWDVDIPTYARAKSLASKANALGKISTTGVTFSGVTTTITVADPTGITAGSVISGAHIVAGTYVTEAYTGGTSVPISTATETGGNSGSYTFSYAGRFVPNQTEAVFSAEISKFIVCLGANPYNPGNFSTAYDPMLVRWSDQDNCYEWTPSVTNQSGEFRLNIGSYLVCAHNTRQEILLWSNAALYSMQYLGPPYVFGFNLLSDNISIASPNAAVTTNNMTFWMGVDKFYAYTGRVEPLPCALQQHVFKNLNRKQLFQIVSGSNEGYNEVWWFYPSADSSVNDRYVIFNYVENLWYHGELSRTAWLDSSLRENPMGAFSTQSTYLIDDVTTDTDEIFVRNAASFPASGTVVIGDEQIAYTERMADRLQGCARGVNNTTPAAHVAYTPVTYAVANQIMYHEVGTDDRATGDVLPIHSYIASADFDIGDGHDFAFVWRMLPDLTFDGSSPDVMPKVTLMIKARTNSGTDYISASNPAVQREAATPLEKFTGYPVTPLNAGQVYTRVRGRQMQFRIESTETGVAWQLGQTRIDIRPDGRRA